MTDLGAIPWNRPAERRSILRRHPGRTRLAACTRPCWAGLLTKLDDRNMALSMWPLCPCGTGDDGAKRYTALGQTIGYGGLIRFPSGMTVMRTDPHFEPLDEGIVSLGQALEKALRG